MKKIILILALVSSLYSQETSESQIIFESPLINEEYAFYSNARLIRIKSEEKIIYVNDKDSFYIFNITRKRSRKLSKNEIDSLITLGHVIKDSPLVAVFGLEKGNDVFVAEKDNKFNKLELPFKNGIAFWFDYRDSVVEIIGGKYYLFRYFIDLNNVALLRLDTITEDRGGIGIL